jgi:large subunit ribosomal protein L9
VTVNVARSADEAERLARGENVTVRREGGEEADEAKAVVAAAEKFFEPGVGEATPEGDEAAAEEPAKA